ncbi:MAG: hypothetical protein H7232_01200, partial [Aeromicrobium sp.]|nr:hypothetical protein [Burkholderiales bacterium]
MFIKPLRCSFLFATLAISTALFAQVSVQGGTQGARQASAQSGAPGGASRTPAADDKLAPIMLDDIHCYSVAHDKMKPFFITHFGAKVMREQPTNPLRFIDFLAISPTQSTINLSPKGPFEGVRVGDPKRWEKETVPPAATLPAMYGVHWIAFTT